MKIIISGTGGQGIKFLGKVLGEILVKLGYEVALTFDFDAAVRGGDSVAFLIYSKGKIDNPIIDTADLFVKLSSQSKDYPTEKRVDNVEGHPINMYALGRLLKELKLDISEDILRDCLPERNKENNLKVILSC